MSKIKRLSDYTHLDNDFVEKCREGVLKLEEYLKKYVDTGKLDTIEQVREMEMLKIEHGSFLTYFIRFYSQVERYKENNEYMSAERKRLKSRVMKEMIKKGDNPTNAERFVYDNEDYISAHESITEIRMFFIMISQVYNIHKDLNARSLHQSISIAQKELENLKRS